MLRCLIFSLLLVAVCEMSPSGCLINLLQIENPGDECHTFLRNDKILDQKSYNIRKCSIIMKCSYGQLTGCIRNMCSGLVPGKDCRVFMAERVGIVTRATCKPLPDKLHNSTQEIWDKFNQGR